MKTDGNVFHLNSPNDTTKETRLGNAGLHSVCSMAKLD